MMTMRSLGLCLFLLAGCAAARAADELRPALPEIPARSFNVADFGAKPGEGIDLNTAAFARAFAAVEKAGGGRLVVGPGDYDVKALTLVSRLDLHLEKGARLLFSKDPEAYRIEGHKFRPLIEAKDVSDLALTGAGVIDGQGEAWWPAERAFKAAAQARGAKNEEMGRPRLLVIEKGRRMLVEGITLENSPQFHFVPSRCEDVTIRGVTVRAPADAPNTDGIDPGASRRVLITGCTIDTGDDDIAIKSGSPGFGVSEDLLIEHCTFLHGHGLSIGSETYGGVKNLVVRDCTFDGTGAGIRMKSSRGKGGVAENLTYEDITMRHVGDAVSISSWYPERKIPEPGEKVAALAPEAPQTPAWRSIVIRRLRATDGTRSAGFIVGLPEEPVDGLTLDDVAIDAPRGLRVGFAKNVVLKGVEIHAAKGDGLLVDPGTPAPRVAP